MKISTSVLSISHDLETCINRLNKTNTDFLHLDVMDGVFVSNNTITEMDEVLKYNKKPLDIHLMVKDVDVYLEKYRNYDPEYLTFHVEVGENGTDMVKKIRKSGIKAGIAINPYTNIEDILPYLSDVDLVLVMSVEAGSGGQTFISSTTERIHELKVLREQNKYHYVIEVDGGINSDTIQFVHDADIVVSGSYITNGNYEERINRLKKY